MNHLGWPISDASTVMRLHSPSPLLHVSAGLWHVPGSVALHPIYVFHLGPCRPIPLALLGWIPVGLRVLAAPEKSAVRMCHCVSTIVCLTLSMLVAGAGLREEAFPPLQRPGNRAPPPTSMGIQAPPPSQAKSEGASLGR
jgi:hypothetical protein